MRPWKVIPRIIPDAVAVSVTLDPIAGSSSFVLAASGTLLGSGAASGTSTLTFSPSATLLGTGAAAGTSTLVFGPSATLLGKGQAVGSSSIVFGSASLSFTVSGTIFQRLWTDIPPSDGTWANDNADQAIWADAASSEADWADHTHSGTWTTAPKTGASWT
jgi:hypothetical protein